MHTPDQTVALKRPKTVFLTVNKDKTEGRRSAKDRVVTHVTAALLSRTAQVRPVKNGTTNQHLVVFARDASYF